MLRRPGIEPGSQEWESCMIPLHQRRFVGSLLSARLAQSVEHETLNLRVVGSSPTLGDHFCHPPEQMVIMIGPRNQLSLHRDSIVRNVCFGFERSQLKSRLETSKLML